MSASYLGPPSYRGRHPRWGFPPVSWRQARVVESAAAPGAPPVTRLRRATYLCSVTSVCALLAAGAETWRYTLLLRGRTELLPGPAVAASDLLVTLASLLAVGCAGLTALAAVPMMVRLHEFAARRAGLQPSRRPASVLARLVVPGWNVYGIGVVTGEIDGLLTVPAARVRPRPTRLVLCWWAVWVGDAMLVLLTLGRAFGRGEQAMADTVELHVALDLTGAAVAGLGALVFRRFRRLLLDDDVGLQSGWVVQPPEPTRPRWSATSDGAHPAS